MHADLTWTLAKLAAVVVLVAVNGFFVAAEFALVGMRRSRVDELAAEGSGAAKLLQRALDTLDTNLAATQLGVTLSSLALGWVGEPAVARLLEPGLRFLPMGREAASVVAGALAFVLITSVAIVLGELAPKNLALQATERTALAIIGPLSAFRSLFRPAIAVLNALGTGVLRLFGLDGRTTEGSLHSPDELKRLVAASTDGGLIEGVQQEVVERAFDMTELQVCSIMTPRHELVWVDADGAEADRMATIRQNRHALTLVARGKLDTLLGVVRKQDLLDAHLDGETLDPVALVREPIIVPEESTVLHVLELFKDRPVQLAVVIDEYGVVQGVVTQTDLLEAMAGDIPEEGERDRISEQPDGSLEMDGATPFATVLRRLELPTETQDGAFHTLGGFCLHKLGELPEAGATFDAGDWRFSVANLDGMRIEKVIAYRAG